MSFYTILLFRGGFSVVVEATSKKDGEKYAVKIIEKNMIQDDIKLLRREIEIMKKVSHPNILKLHEIYETDEKVYIVMELYVHIPLIFQETCFYSESSSTFGVVLYAMCTYHFS